MNNVAMPISEKKKRKPRSDSRQRLLDSANRLFREHGYSGTTLSQIAKTGEAPMGSVYFHFPDGKEQIAVEAISAGADKVSEELREILSGHDDVAEALAACALKWSRDLTSSQWTAVCPIAATALQMSTSSESIRKTALKYFDMWRNLFFERLLTADIPEDTAHYLADTTLSLLEGAELSARVARDSQPLENAARTIRDLVSANLR